MDTYDVTYQYSPRYGNHAWHLHSNLDREEADLMLRMLWVLDRNCRVRQNATGRVVEALFTTDQPLTLLHLFFKSISDRNGKGTVGG